MHINPIYRKELKLSTRSLKLPITFMIYTLIMTGVACLFCSVLYNSYYRSSTQYEQVITIFVCLAVAQVVILALEIPAFTADAIAGERERQTLDILLTTSLRPIQIVIGKLLSSLSTLFLLTFLTLPVLGITFAIGGIHIKDLVQLYCFILITMFFIGSMGIYFSTVFKRTAMATVASYAGMIFFTVGTFFIVGIAALLMELHNNQIGMETGVYPDLDLGILPVILFANPAVTMAYMLVTNYGSMSIPQECFKMISFDKYTFLTQYWFALSVLVQLLLGILFLWRASKRLDPLNKKHNKSNKHEKHGKRDKHKNSELS